MKHSWDQHATVVGSNSTATFSGPSLLDTQHRRRPWQPWLEKAHTSHNRGLGREIGIALRDRPSTRGLANSGKEGPARHAPSAAAQKGLLGTAHQRRRRRACSAQPHLAAHWAWSRWRHGVTARAQSYEEGWRARGATRLTRLMAQWCSVATGQSQTDGVWHEWGRRERKQTENDEVFLLKRRMTKLRVDETISCLVWSIVPS
jgi:hypothetical protein